MQSYRVFIEAVGNADDPALIARLARFCHRDESAVRVMLGNLPALLAERVDEASAARLQGLLESMDARVLLKPMSDTRAGGVARGGSVALGWLPRLSWGLTVLGHTWGRQLLLLACAMSVMVSAHLGMLGLLVWLGDARLSTEAPLQLIQSPLVLAVILALQVVTMLAGFWYLAGLYRLIGAFMEDGGAFALRAVMLDAWRRTPELITTLGVLGLPLLPLFGGFGIGIADWPSQGESWVIPLLTLALGLLIVSILFGFALGIPAAVYERISPWTALRRGWMLGAGRRWSLFLNMLLGGWCVVGLGYGLSALLHGLWQSSGLSGLPLLLGAGLSGLLAVVVLLLLSGFVLAFLSAAHYFEARVGEEGWSPGWMVVPNPSWSVSERQVAVAAGRGGRAWLEWLSYTLVGFVLLVPGLFFAADRLGGSYSAQALSGQWQHWLSESLKTPAELQMDRPAAQFTVRLAQQPVAPASRLVVGVELRDLPEMPKGMDLARLVDVRIESVLEPDGTDLYDPQSRQEQGANHWVRLSDAGAGRFAGQRGVQLRRGVKPSGDETVRGWLSVRLPVQPMRVEFRREGSVEVLNPFPGTEVSLLSFVALRVALEVRGADAMGRLFGFSAHGRAGAEIEPEMLTMASRDDRVLLNGNFHQAVRSVRLYLARRVDVYRWPFVLRADTPQMLQSSESLAGDL